MRILEALRKFPPHVAWRCIVISLAAIALTFQLQAGVATPSASDVPGLEMDASSKRLFENWEKNVYHFDRGRISHECEISIARGLLEKASFTGTYQINGIGRIDWRTPEGRSVEQGWWLKELNNLMDGGGRLLWLPNCKLTAESKADGTTVRVEGRSPFRTFQFNRDGVLTGFVISPQPSSEMKVELTHEKRDGVYMLMRYVLTGTASSGASASEDGNIEYGVTRGRLEPTSMSIALRNAGQTASLHIYFFSWKHDQEARVSMNRTAREAFENWETARDYNLARFRIYRASCNVAYSGGGKSTTGKYQWDGENGQVAWKDAEQGRQLAQSGWQKEIDRIFQPYPLRRQLEFHELVGQPKGGGTNCIILEIGSSIDSPRGNLAFGVDGNLEEFSRSGSDPRAKTRIYDLVLRRQVYEDKHAFAGATKYYLPTSWSEASPDPVKSTESDKGGIDAWLKPTKMLVAHKSFEFVQVRQFDLPGKLTIREGAKTNAPSAVYSFSNWEFEPEPRVYFPKQR